MEPLGVTAPFHSDVGEDGPVMLYEVDDEYVATRSEPVESGVAAAWEVLRANPDMLVGTDVLTVSVADDDGALVGLDGRGRPLVAVATAALDQAALVSALTAAARRADWDLENVAACAARAPQPRGRDAFLADWLDFASRSTPLPTSPGVTLVLVVHDAAEGLEPTLRLLRGTAFELRIVRARLHEVAGRRLVTVERLHEIRPREPAAGDGGPPETQEAGSLLASGVLEAPEELVFVRRRTGQRHTAVLHGDGAIVLRDGSRYRSPSAAARDAAGMRAIDGWSAWRVPRLKGRTLAELRDDTVHKPATTGAEAMNGAGAAPVDVEVDHDLDV